MPELAMTEETKQVEPAPDKHDVKIVDLTRIYQASLSGPSQDPNNPKDRKDDTHDSLRNLPTRAANDIDSFTDSAYDDGIIIGRLSSSNSRTPGNTGRPYSTQKLPHRTRGGATKMSKTTIQIDNETVSLNRDDVAPETWDWCPWHMLYKYLQFVGTTSARMVADDFSKAGLLEDRTWDFFYICTDIQKKGIILVPTAHVKAFLEELNIKHCRQLAIPPGHENRQLFEFYFNPAHSPPVRYLGRSTKVAHLEQLRNAIPSQKEENYTKTEHTSDIFDILYQANDLSVRHGNKKNKKKTSKAPERRKDWGYMMKRIQRYLGLRNRNPTFETIGTASGLDDYLKQKEKLKSDAMVQIDLTKNVPFTTEDNVVFICLDIEWHEENQNAITEVGIAILEAQDVKDVPPGVHGENWHQLIKARHIRVREYLGHRNHKFCVGWPDRFQFGESEVVPLNRVAEEMNALFSSYHNPDAPADSRDGEIVLVGHGLDGDIASLRKLGVNVYNIPNLREVVDTQNMHKTLLKRDNGPGLQATLDVFEMQSMYLHNGGNDAVYTMRAMMALAIRKRLFTLDLVHGRSKNAGIQGEGWSSDELNDGGAEPPLFDPEKFKHKGRVRGQNRGNQRGHRAGQAPAPAPAPRRMVDENYHPPWTTQRPASPKPTSPTVNWNDGGAWGNGGADENGVASGDDGGPDIPPELGAASVGASLPEGAW